MKLKLFGVTFLTLWVSVMFALALGKPVYERYWGEADTSHSVIVPITVKPMVIPKPPETVVEKMQERVESPPIRPAVVEECPAVETEKPATIPAAKRKTKLRRLVKKAPPPGPVLVGGQPQ